MSYQQNIVGGYFLIGAACIAEASNMSVVDLIVLPVRDAVRVPLFAQDKLQCSHC